MSQQSNQEAQRNPYQTQNTERVNPWPGWNMIAAPQPPPQPHRSSLNSNAPVFIPPGTATASASVDSGHLKNPPPKKSVVQKGFSPPDNKPKKKRKPQPTLKTMSISDLMPSVNSRSSNKQRDKPSTKAARTSSSTTRSAQSNNSLQMNPSYVSDFPALSSGRLSASSPLKPPPQSMKILKSGESLPKTAPKAKSPAKKKTPMVKEQKAVSITDTNPATSKMQGHPGLVGDENRGGEHDLLRLMMTRDGGMMVVQKKGRQRLRPRKKKFSALKKKVLQERLRKWRELHPEAPALPADVDDSTCTVCVYGFAEPDELEDDDEYEEIVTNLQEMANKVGPVKQVFIPRDRMDRTTETYPAFVAFESKADATAAVSCWDGLVIGGQQLAAKPLVGSLDSDATEWTDWCLRMEQVVDEPEGCGDDTCAEVALTNVLTQDDLEDEDVFEESMSDIRVLAEKFGPVESIRLERVPDLQVVVAYRGGLVVAQQAAQELGKTVVGGSKVSALVRTKSDSSQDGKETAFRVVLRNLLADEDLEDADCLEESLTDARELASQYGAVTDISCIRDSVDGAVELQFSDLAAAKAAVEGFNGMVIGGQTVSASFSNVNPAELDTEQLPSETKEAAEKTMFSGEKRIPERFAECLRVPKVSNTGEPRKYATLLNDDSVKPLLIEMLGELMRLQRRAMKDKNAKARRRLVMGLREVARGIRAHKVKLVVMANNLDQYGVIDEKLQEIIDSAHSEGVPVFFELNKRALGKAIGKSIKIAVVGVQNADGAHQQFKKLVSLAPT